MLVLGLGIAFAAADTAASFRIDRDSLPAGGGPSASPAGALRHSVIGDGIMGGPARSLRFRLEGGMPLVPGRRAAARAAGWQGY